MSILDKHPLPWKAVGFAIWDANDRHVATAAGDVAAAAMIVEAVNAPRRESSKMSRWPMRRIPAHPK